MPYDPKIHHPGSRRLSVYDYSWMGSYFVTVCVHQRKCLFGSVTPDGCMLLNSFGRIVAEEWENAVAAFPDMRSVLYVVMPNHFHGIITFLENVHEQPASLHPAKRGAIRESPLRPGNTLSPLPTTISTRNERRNMGLAKLMGRFKMCSSKRINLLRGASGERVWQRNYYDHIIRSEIEMANMAEYIETNPARWGQDSENPDSPRRSKP